MEEVGRGRVGFTGATPRNSLHFGGSPPEAIHRDSPRPSPAATGHESQTFWSRRQVSKSGNRTGSGLTRTIGRKTVPQVRAGLMEMCVGGGGRRRGGGASPLPGAESNGN